jgi:hypothetical protein
MKQETIEKVKDLNYWKNNAEEDYLAVPISVLRYISELEKQQEKELEHWKAQSSQQIKKIAYGNE